ncbi:hypothetical protein UlMin_026331 [Ulmus minor]
MEKVLLLKAFVVLSFAILTTCSATTFTVGDGSGWDISTDLDSWASDKTFNVGDVLVFQYSSPESVGEVTKPNFEKCNTNDVLRTYSSGNTTVTLTKPGERYFVSGNKLYCLGGMKLKVNVQGNQAYAPAGAPAGAPEAATGSDQNGNSLPNPSSKSNFPASTAFTLCTTNAFVLSFLSFVVSFIWNV